MADDRSFVPGMHYTRKGCTSPPREGEPEIQFGSIGSPGGLGGSRVRDIDIDREAMQTFKNLATGQQ